MTGFAAVAAELPGCSLTVELRSVNHRYLDLQVRLPDELRSIESSVRDTLAKQLKRGKVDCRVALNRSAPGTAELAVNAARIVQLRDAANEVLHHAPGQHAPFDRRDPSLAGRSDGGVPRRGSVG